MKRLLIAVGQLKNGPEKVLFDYYNLRLNPALQVHELPNKKNSTKAEEGQLILKVLSSTDYVIALDEKGEDLSTREFHHLLEERIPSDVKNCSFVIGGADGLSEDVKSRSQFLLRFGRMTWPHLLVRTLLAEQLYRSQQIKNNHPYHRD